MKATKIIVTLSLATILLAACGKGNSTPASKSQESSTAKVVTESPKAENSSLSISSVFKGENGHSVKGKATIEKGKLMLSDFTTDDGPDLRVYLSKGTDSKKAKEIAKIDLNKKEQTFDLSDINPEEYDTILIYCNKAHELFGSATYEKLGTTNTSTSLTGKFAGLNEKNVQGQVTIEGNKVMLSNFTTDDGPDLHVYLIKDDQIDGGIEVGKLELNKEDQTFTLPDGIDLKEYKKVAIYCEQAHIFFGEAVL
ncbi:DM13 domain-containing protein [Carnobacterium gallinarum]|uniref:DM13 domain-containing protein n=1 Tax=Carnobacterium gallinarum TaxID=2749 RepID=UPI00055242FE|nr:DM13 domain-containing protein [Carnobacterium gallinarum]